MLPTLQVCGSRSCDPVRPKVNFLAHGDSVMLLGDAFHQERSKQVRVDGQMDGAQSGYLFNATMNENEDRQNYKYSGWLGEPAVLQPSIAKTDISTVSLWLLTISFVLLKLHVDLCILNPIVPSLQSVFVQTAPVGSRSELVAETNVIQPTGNKCPINNGRSKKS